MQSLVSVCMQLYLAEFIDPLSINPSSLIGSTLIKELKPSETRGLIRNYTRLINRVPGPYGELPTRFWSIFMAQARSARVMRKKQGSVTYGTDRANEVNKMFIIWLFFLLF